MVLQISSMDPILKFPLFSMYDYQTSWGKVRKPTNAVWFFFGHFDLENIEIILTELANTPFLAIVLMKNLITISSESKPLYVDITTNLAKTHLKFFSLSFSGFTLRDSSLNNLCISNYTQYFFHQTVIFTVVIYAVSFRFQ